VLAKVNQEQLAPDATVESVARPVACALTPDMSLSVALEAFLRERATVLPVTPDQWRNTLLGEVSRHDLMLAIQDRMRFPQ
jgi:CBS domain-containing protein